MIINANGDKLTITAGDSLSKIANDVLGDYSQWRELAYVNDLNIFQPLEAGITIDLPNRAELQAEIDSVTSRVTSAVNNVESRVNEIVNSREAQLISKILGVDTSKLLEGLDLSSITENLSDLQLPDYQLLNWVL
ncbi:LysM peptidoglycan-binding domain-containing protein [Picosynechococcus sp. PCC 7117]|uniref:LysM peptidoglycan-binding domain-containing protein n=1 Tax=Picosynechococcus sp. PCC 7117 TaxID=195498 RepID=UPI000810BA4D|nr:hypothetical protein [Picosynechococcus sp. PCC 7117]ANV88499.1 hypothetical protein AWQ22_14085 [Picosynechococcus sp. PCC 7117]